MVRPTLNLAANENVPNHFVTLFMYQKGKASQS